MAHTMSDRDQGSDPSSQARLYDPYQGLQVPIPARNVYQLPTTPQYLFDEEARRQRRGWSDNITFFTGCGYLSGALCGGASGLVSGVRSFESGDTAKLRLNRVLNASGHAGRAWGNRIGIIGLIYAGMESGIVALRDTDDVWNSVAAGLGTGAVYRAARGVRSAAVAGAVGGVLVGLAVTGKQAMKRYVPL
ncbi:mitochondrial import inner membrane translocase subunit TIM23-1-like [Alnus glutinosa]|uniref:mitochondrial import inner membrane translocase subunit TIM23-1-like n=1 Tax=Alnus glutinosa TaxID=3517 RepID=UPI002D7789D7|nr:mitochondrial import inner membrane translocase subunit TIM23-1-like [Alnus glutinosa]